MIHMSGCPHDPVPGASHSPGSGLRLLCKNSVLRTLVWGLACPFRNGNIVINNRSPCKLLPDKCLSPLGETVRAVANVDIDSQLYRDYQ